MNYEKGFIFLLVSFFFVIIHDAVAGSVQHRISLQQARELVWATLSPLALRLPNIGIISPDKDPKNIISYECPENPRFLSFAVIWSGLPYGICYFAVDSYTGDVIHTNADCDTYNIKKLAVLQKKVRRSIHLTDRQYRKIKIKNEEEVLAC